MSNPADAITARTTLTIAGERVSLEATVPKGNVRPAVLLPILRPLADRIVDIAIKQSEAAGRPISCKAGCGACCRQIVPVTATEAVRIEQVVEEMPEPRRSEIRARFAAAEERFKQAGLLDALDGPPLRGKENLRTFGLSYFAVGVPCPFLEDESCSIYPERPLACREYLATTPSENCAHPTRDTIECVEMPGKPSNALAWAEKPDDAERPGWVPLVRALAWSARHRHTLPKRPGPALLKSAFSHLTGDEIE
jgi:Fe-S-cluster containining protein